MSAIDSSPSAAVPSNASANTQPNIQALRSRILVRVCELTKPAAPLAAWQRLGTVEAVRTLDGNSDELVAKLREEFTPSDLLAARVAETAPGDQLQLSPVFGHSDADSFILRCDSQGLPTDAVSSRGVLSCQRPEWLQRSREIAPRGPFGQPLVVSLSDTELAVVCRFGIECSSAIGLGGITGKRVRELFRGREKVPLSNAQFKITVLGWQPDKRIFDFSPENLQIVWQLADIRGVYGFDPSSVFDVWIPSESERRRIERAYSFSDPVAIASAFKASLQHPRYSPQAALTWLKDRQSASYSAARRELESSLTSSRFVPLAGDVEVALAKFHKAFQQLVVRPLEKTHDRASPYESWCGMISADLARSWFDGLEVVVSARRVIAGQHPGAPSRLDDAELDRKLRMVDHVVKLARLDLARKSQSKPAGT
jgi:hypothetical protein